MGSIVIDGDSEPRSAAGVTWQEQVRQRVSSLGNPIVGVFNGPHGKDILLFLSSALVVLPLSLEFTSLLDGVVLISFPLFSSFLVGILALRLWFTLKG